MTPREPDHFDKQALELFRKIHYQPNEGDAERIAAALRAEHASALERAAQVVEEAHQMWRLRDIAQEIRALVPPAAAPAADPHAPYCCADAKDGGPDHSVDCPHFTVPASPDLRAALTEAKDALERIWAAIGDRLLGEGPLSKEYAHGVTRKVNAALTQIRFTLSVDAAPAAETGKVLTNGQRAQVSVAAHRQRLKVLFDENEQRPLPDTALRGALLDADRFANELCAIATAPIATAQGAEAPDWWQDAINKTAATNREILARAEKAEALLRECEEWMRGRLRHMGTGTVERISCETLLAKLAARAAPPEREGK